jgi:hypothetical protein
MTTPLEAALAYAAFCGIFPCTARKTPIKIEGLFEHGFESATTDVAVITETWTKYKAADIGLALPHGVLVIDVDAANGKRGRDDFVRLFGCAPEEMETAVATTARGGWHVYFRFDLSLGLVQRSIGQSVDTRIGGKGYVIAPSPGNGRHWVRSLLTTALMEAPGWLIERLKERGESEPRESTPFNGETSARAMQALEGACAGLSHAAPGTRDKTIGLVVYRVGRLAGAGELESGSARQALLAAMAANPGTDKSHRDKVERCFNDGFKHPAEPGPIDDRHATEDDFGVENLANDHRDSGGASDGERASGQQQQQSSSAGGAQSESSGWDPIDLDLFLAGSDLPPPELSDDALPNSWAEIIRAYAAVAEAPPDYVAIASIAGAAGAIGNACVVEGKRGWREPAVLWGMLIGPPSAHKTPAMKAAHSALAAIDHELYVEWKKECEQLDVQHQMALDAQAAAKEPKKSVKKPEKPPLKHLLHDDTSLEKLTINMAASGHGAVAFYSELGGCSLRSAATPAAAMTAVAAPYGTGRRTPNASRETGSRTRARRSSFPPPPARLSARSSPTSFGKSGPSLMTGCWRGRSTSGRAWRRCHRENPTTTATIFPAARLTPSRRPSRRSTICRSSSMTRASIIPRSFVWRSRRARHSTPRSAIASGGRGESAGSSANGSARGRAAS